MNEAPPTQIFLKPLPKQIQKSTEAPKLRGGRVRQFGHEGRIAREGEAVAPRRGEGEDRPSESRHSEYSQILENTRGGNFNLGEVARLQALAFFAR